MIEKWKIAVKAIAGFAIALTADVRYLSNSQLLMPNECKEIKTIVKNLGSLMI